MASLPAANTNVALIATDGVAPTLDSMVNYFGFRHVADNASLLRAEAQVGEQFTVGFAISDIVLGRALLDHRIARAFRTLVAHRSWTEAIATIVEIGGVQQAEIARILKVERSTVARWVVGASVPPNHLTAAYALRLAAGMERSSRSYVNRYLSSRTIKNDPNLLVVDHYAAPDRNAKSDLRQSLLGESESGN